MKKIRLNTFAEKVSLMIFLINKKAPSINAGSFQKVTKDLSEYKTYCFTILAVFLLPS